jgi:hypothetical protein
MMGRDIRGGEEDAEANAGNIASWKRNGYGRADAPQERAARQMFHLLHPPCSAFVISNRGIQRAHYCSEMTTPGCVDTPPTVAESGTSPVPRPAGTVKLI